MIDTFLESATQLPPMARFGIALIVFLMVPAFCRRVPNWVGDDRTRATIELVERLADGSAAEAERESALADPDLREACWPLAVALVGSESVQELAEVAMHVARRDGVTRDDELAARCDIIRDIVGNPFHLVQIDPSWLAWNDGVVSCPNGMPETDAAASALGLDDGFLPVNIPSFGYPKRPLEPESKSAEDWSRDANRKPLEELVRRI